MAKTLLWREEFKGRIIGENLGGVLVVTSYASEGPPPPALPDPILKYDFTDNAGLTVKDSGQGEPYSLTVSDPQKVDWGVNCLKLNPHVSLSAASSAKKLMDALRASNEMTVLIWGIPDNSTQALGRILSLAGDINTHNLLIAQNTHWLRVRCRTSNTPDDGSPSLDSDPDTMTPSLLHMAYTHASDGTETIYINGKEQSTQGTRPGDFSNWGDYRLVVGNEITGDRGWAGVLIDVRLYDEALSAQEVADLYKLGPGAYQLPGDQGTVPEAQFSASPTSPLVGQTVQFRDESTGVPTTWLWDFGDGVGTSTERNPSYAYGKAGEYTVSLTVSNAGGSSTATRAAYIKVRAEVLEAQFSASPRTPVVGQAVQFRDESTGSPTTWLWNFGDGQGTSTEKNPSYTYNAVGEYTVSLTVSNAQGSASVTKAAYIKVTQQELPLEARFSMSTDRGYAPLDVDFYDESQGNPVRWEWLFGDGATSDLRNPSHQYKTPGGYAVTLVVDDSAGNTDAAYDSVTVWEEKEPPPPPQGEDGVTVVELPFPRADTATYQVTRYVDDRLGSDSSDGRSPGKGAWKTLDKAGSSASAGDVVLVAPGTYTSPLKITGNGTKSRPIIFLGDGAHGDVVIDPSSQTPAIVVQNRKWVLVENFYVDWNPGYDETMIDVQGAESCTFRRITATNGKNAQKAHETQSNNARGMNAYTTQNCWFDQMVLAGAKVGASFGKAGGYNYISYCVFKDCGKHNMTYNDAETSGCTNYEHPNYPYNNLYYRCWFDSVWTGDNIQHVSPGCFNPNWQNKWAFRHIIYKQCVFSRSAENALDLKDSRHIYLDQCMFYAGVGSDGWQNAFDEHAPTVNVGAESNGEMWTIRKSIFWDCSPGPTSYWQGYVAAHNTMIHCNRNQKGAGNDTMVTGRAVGYYGFRHNKDGRNQMIVNNLVFDQLGAEGSWSDATGANCHIDGNAYGENKGGDGLKWAKVKNGSNTWDGTSSFSNWQDWLAGLGVKGADKNGMADVSPPFKDVPAYPDWEKNGNHLEGNYDFRPKESSEVVGAAATMAVTTNSGGGTDTVINVDNAYPFCDGFGIMVPDYIRIAGQQRAEVVSVDYGQGRITIKNPGITWKQGDRIDYDYEDEYGGPTIGALQPGDEKWWENVAL